MERAWIAGEPATLDAAVAEAAKVLHASRHPLIAGLGTDVAGARAAIMLAKRAGAVIDHMNSDALLRDLDVMRSSGVILTTAGEARVRADTLLLIGPGLIKAWPELPPRLFGNMRQPKCHGTAERQILWLCPGDDLARLPPAATIVETIGKDPNDLPTLLAVLRARVAGRPTGKIRISSKTLDDLSAGLKASRFGVAIWSAATLDALTIEMLCGLLDDLNTTTRFCGLPLSPGDNAAGVLQTCGWLTGFPMRSGFRRGSPQHDPWLFDGCRLVESGETDCVLWISAYHAQAPAWGEAPLMIALTGRAASFRVPPHVHIDVGHPGIDHASVEHMLVSGTLAMVAAKEPSDTISVADALARIAAALPTAGDRSC